MAALISAVPSPLPVHPRSCPNSRCIRLALSFLPTLRRDGGCPWEEIPAPCTRWRCNRCCRGSRSLPIRRHEIRSPRDRRIAPRESFLVLGALVPSPAPLDVSVLLRRSQGSGWPLTRFFRFRTVPPASCARLPPPPVSRCVPAPWQHRVRRLPPS